MTAILRGATIPHTEAAQHVGEIVTVTGTVSRVSAIPSGMTFINFGTRGAADSFTAVARAGISDAETLKAFEGKSVEVSGTVEIYKDSPQIVLKNAADIRINGEALAPGAAPSMPDSTEKPESTGVVVKAFTVPLEKKEIRAAGVTFAGAAPSEVIASVVLPEKFDPAKPHRILAVFPDFFTKSKPEKLLEPYLPVVSREGWIVLTARGEVVENDLPPRWHSVMFQAAIRHLSSEYPGIPDWPIYLAGNADGATRATLSTGAMLEEKLDVRGCFLSSLKREDLGKSMETFGSSERKMKKLKVFVSLGKQDSLIKDEDSLKAAAAIGDAGVKQVRHEIHEGRTGADPASLEAALDWFEEEQ